VTAPQLATAVANVPVDRLMFHPRNIRRQLGDLRELAASIAQVGVLQPLLVERRLGAEVLRVLAGHRRLQASRMAGLKKVPCVLVEPHTDAGAIALMLTENLQRAGLSHLERRDAVQALIREGGYTVAQVAQLLGVHATTVYGWLRADEDDHQPPQPIEGSAPNPLPKPATRPARPGGGPRTSIHPRNRPTAIATSCSAGGRSDRTGSPPTRSPSCSMNWNSSFRAGGRRDSHGPRPPGRASQPGPRRTGPGRSAM